MARKQGHNPFKILKREISKRFLRSKIDKHPVQTPPNLKPQSIDVQPPDDDARASNTTPPIQVEAQILSSIPLDETDKKNTDVQPVPFKTSSKSDSVSAVFIPTIPPPHASPVKPSDWDTILIGSDEEDEGGKTKKIETAPGVGIRGTQSRKSSLNATLEKYIPGWRLLLHSLLIPIIKYNVEVADWWVNKLSSILPFKTIAPDVAPPSIGFLPMYQGSKSIRPSQECCLHEERLKQQKSFKP